MNNMIIGDVNIHTDWHGRLNFNVLHKASGTGKHKEPNMWLVNKDTKALIEVYEKKLPRNSWFGAISTFRGGKSPGTYAIEQLAVAYANWISPEFYAHVIDTFLAVKNELVKRFPKNMREAFELAEEYASKLEQQNDHLLQRSVPKQLHNISGSLCITDAGKNLGFGQRKFFNWLKENRWIYQRSNYDSYEFIWVGYQDKIDNGFIEHRIITLINEEGKEELAQQCRITLAGINEIRKQLEDK